MASDQGKLASEKGGKMRVRLAGYNCDVGTFRNGTPETLVNAYARACRSRKDLQSLHDKSNEDITKTRKYNEKILKKYKHESVSEHAVFSFDFNGITRYAVEHLESFRLCSFSERSQRYVKVKTDCNNLPQVTGSPFWKKIKPLIQKQKSLYEEMCKGGIPIEDARYVCMLLNQTQLGMTLNARNLNHVIDVLNVSPIQELRGISIRLQDELYQIAPSLRCYRWLIPENLPNITPKWEPYSTYEPSVEILFHTPLQYYDTSFYGRNLEHFYFTFRIYLSSSAYAQFKRHRMCTIVPQDYDTKLGVTVPESIKESEFYKRFLDFTRECSYLSEEIKESPIRAIAPYVLTNAHKREITVTMNLRELDKFVDLRMAPEAQAEIRSIAEEMADSVVTVLKESPFPLSLF
jgi:thymidylate synthase ThyX